MKSPHEKALGAKMGKYGKQKMPKGIVSKAQHEALRQKYKESAKYARGGNEPDWSTK